MASAADIQAKIDALEAKVAGFAGVRNNSFSDQSVTFSLDDAHKELARLRQLLVAANHQSTTRYGMTRKGC